MTGITILQNQPLCNRRGRKDDFLCNEVIAKAVMFPAVISPSPYISARIIRGGIVFKRCSEPP
ncbi:hypothetical protein J6590_058266 [Homalodisca vitripennis]|nr:hypothetical protein J6590_058266 [Homalodisca vitripennis]